jgi:hypothetical protein
MSYYPMVAFKASFWRGQCCFEKLPEKHSGSEKTSVFGAVLPENDHQWYQEINQPLETCQQSLEALLYLQFVGLVL